MSRTKKLQQESPSKRLKNVFYLLWEKDDEKFEEFEDYYASKMEKLITHYKKMI
jgi:hypothetical protein